MSHELYLSLPPVCQNVALSLYGLTLYKQRFGNSLPSAYSTASPLFSIPTLEDTELQTLRLRKLLTHCQAYVPYYKPFLKSVDISSITVATLGDYIPKLTKKIILERPADFLSQAPEHNVKQLLKLNTSGSSGTPLTLFATHEARQINYMYYQRALNEFRCSYRSKSTTFAGRILYKKLGNSPARYDYFNRTQYLSSYFISLDTIDNYIFALNKWQPEFIDAYPSALLEICTLARQKNLFLNFSPKVVLTSSETLTSEARVAIESFFAAPVLDHYGCTEMAISAFSAGGKYFAHAHYSVIELEPAFDNLYSVITSGLLNFAMPLLRYEIGDLVSKSFADSNYVFDSIEGRADDVIVTPEGTRIGRMDPVFKGIKGIEMAQIIQENISEIVVLIVLNKEQAKDFNSILLIENIKTRTSSSIQIKIHYVDTITKEKNGKFKSVISKINKTLR